MPTHFRMLCWLLLFPLFSWPLSNGFAAGAIYVGDNEAYGWCSGYRGSELTRKCALEQCQGSEGVDCQLALECSSGWGPPLQATMAVTA